MQLEFLGVGGKEKKKEKKRKYLQSKWTIDEWIIRYRSGSNIDVKQRYSGLSVRQETAHR